MTLKICEICQQHMVGAICVHCNQKVTSKPMMSIALLLGLGMNTACWRNVSSLYGKPEELLADNDGDGWSVSDECDDTDPNTYPGAAFNDDEYECMKDSDGDGYGDANPENEDVTPGTDCDDTDPDVNPENGSCE